jgi:FemAB-related protein (PEP-CTERM system-associated)
MNAIAEAVPGQAAAPAAGAAPVLRLLEPKDYARWDAFVDACPSATFFHKAGWQRVVEQAFGHQTWFYYVEEAGTITGVLPLGEINSRLFGHFLGSLPFCVYGGAAVVNERARALLEQAAEDLARQLGAGHLEYRVLTPAHPDDPAFHVKDLYYTFRKEISADHEANLNAIPRKQRAMVRKGIKLGLTGVIDTNVDRLFTAYATSVHRLGTPVFPKRYFALLQEVFGEQCEVRVILQGETLVAAVLSFYFRDEVIPYYGGGMDIARQVAGNDFMYWNLMEFAANRGCRLYDFGRSKAGTGAFDFKKNWGFTAQPLPYEYKLFAAPTLPDNNPLNPKYQLFIKMWKKLPLPVANFLGPFIVKDLG